MKLPVGAKIRIDYKRVFLISELLISGIHCNDFDKIRYTFSNEWNQFYFKIHEKEENEQIFYSLRYFSAILKFDAS